MSDSQTQEALEGVAVIGMAGRFPGARSVAAFWELLRDGVEGITFFSDEQLLAAGVDPAALRDPQYVKAWGQIEEADLFDAAFFGISPREAELIDPQQRVFLECAWHALEDASYDPQRYDGLIGVYAGIGANSYAAQLLSNPELVQRVGAFQIDIANSKEALATRVSYKLGLKGPSLVVQCACSTALAAVHLACLSLLSYECDMALAGGAAVRVPEAQGYVAQEGGIAAPDGHCRAFDAEGRGVVGGNGAGVFVLKRLQDAVADGDTIRAVIKGSAINNDGAAKLSFTAPSVDGQAAVIAAAQAVAGVAASSISYVEAHGAGTPLGDPIEVAALSRVFRADTDTIGACAIGSVKTNVGHLHEAAGVAGLTKTILALEHKLLPPTLHFSRPNPAIDWPSSPFYVNTELRPWPREETPRRAGVSAFGIGGTNVHLIVEEAPERAPIASAPVSPWQLLVLSAKTSTALETMTDNLAAHLAAQPELELADVAYTLQAGRQAFAQRRVLVCRDRDEAVEALRSRDPQRLLSETYDLQTRPVAFMFSGVGDQYVGMARGLYESEPVFREHVDRGADLLRRQFGLDLQAVLYPDQPSERSQPAGIDLRQMLRRGATAAEAASGPVHQTAFIQPALFVIEYALAQLWQHWGVQPAALIGYSVGEYVAACLAGVMSLEDALYLVARRAQLIQELPAGAMLGVPLAEAELRPLLHPEGTRDLALAAINGAHVSIVSGTVAAIDALEQQLSAAGLACRRLSTTHAFHSQMLEPIAATLTAEVARITLHAPEIPYLSNVSGTWITAAEATDPSYWARHMCETVRFADGLRTLQHDLDPILLEIGPGQTLCSIALAGRAATSQPPLVLPSLRNSYDQQPDRAFWLRTLGRLWLAGVPIDWEAGGPRQRVPLPAYPFERQRYWVAARRTAADARPAAAVLQKHARIDDWFSVPAWKQTPPRPAIAPTDPASPDQSWLIFADRHGLGTALAERLGHAGGHAIIVQPGARFSAEGDERYTIDPQRREDYAELLQALHVGHALPQHVVHLWSLTPETADDENEPESARFASLVLLGQALGQHYMAEPVEVWTVTSRLHAIESADQPLPERAALLAPARVAAQEYPNLTWRTLDLRLSADVAPQVEQVLAELHAPTDATVVAYRGRQRWVQTFEPLPLSASQQSGLREQGVYLITEGLSALGVVLAERIAQAVPATLVLTGRAALPEPSGWARWLATHSDGEPHYTQIARGQRLIERGAQVAYITLDLLDQQRVQTTIAELLADRGALHGVVGITEDVDEELFSAIQAADVAACERYLERKRAALASLQAALQQTSIDFCLLPTSISSVLGGVGAVAYTAASLIADQIARQEWARQRPWLSMNIDRWHEQASEQAIVSRTFHTLQLSPEEQRAVLDRVLLLRDVPQVLVSSGDLQTRLSQWVQPGARQEPAAAATTQGGALHERPRLPNSYVAPRSEIEQAIAEMWQGLLGIASIGIYDNFFELGGHSLLGLQLIGQLRERYRVDLPLPTLFETPTVAGLASATAALLAGDLAAAPG